MSYTLSVCLAVCRCSVIAANSEHLVLQKVIKVCLSLIPRLWDLRPRNETHCSTRTIHTCNPGIWIAHNVKKFSCIQCILYSYMALYIITGVCVWMLVVYMYACMLRVVVNIT